MYAALQQVAPSAVYFNPIFSLPPLGTCTVFGIDQGWLALLAPPATELDGGSAITVTGPAGKANVSASPAFAGLLGKTPDIAGAPPLLYSGSGSFGFSLPGGAQIGPLSSSFTMPQPFTWTNRDQISIVDRRQPLTVNWTGVDGSDDIVLIAGRSSDVPHNVDGIFLCAAAAGDGTFTVPQYVLAALPASVSVNSVPAAEIAVGAAAYLTPRIFSAAGLDSGWIIPRLFTLKTAVIR
jgi:hypothetical protein